MEMIESLIGLVRYGAYAFVGGIGLLVVAAVLFGKRVDKKWDYEAEFRDERGREIGEFDVECFRVIEDERAVTQPDYQLKAKFVLRHPALVSGARLRVRLMDTIVFDTTVSEGQRVRLGKEDLVGEIKDPEAGQPVTVEIGGVEVLNEPLRRD